MGHTQERGVGRGKKLKRLIRGWWIKGGVGQGLRNEGCREEGDQPGYIASGYLTQ